MSIYAEGAGASELSPIKPVITIVEVGFDGTLSEAAWERFAARVVMESPDTKEAVLEADISGIVGNCGENCVIRPTILATDSGETDGLEIILGCRFSSDEEPETARARRQQCLLHHLQANRRLHEVVERQAM